MKRHKTKTDMVTIVCMRDVVQNIVDRTYDAKEKCRERKSDSKRENNVQILSVVYSYLVEMQEIKTKRKDKRNKQCKCTTN